MVLFNFFFFAVTSDAQVLAAMSKPKVLFLHGYGESSMMSGMSTGALTKALTEANIEMLPVPDGYRKLKTDADFAPIADEDYKKMCQDGELDAFAWFPLRDGRDSRDGGHRSKPARDFEFRSDSADVAAAVKKLCGDIDKMGGVDGVMGFSQGGELAYLLAEGISQLKTRDKLKFIVRNATRAHA
jgi:hypothetical protein